MTSSGRSSAKRAGRPVQLMLDREAENLAVGNRNPTRQRVRIGARRDGTLTAIEATISLSTGAYQVGGEASNVQGTYQSLYRCPNVRTEQTAIYTNTGPAVAFRAPGFVEAAFALEQAMDELARELGIDPLDLRLRNYAETDQIEEKPYSLPEALRACYDRATDAFGWKGYQKPAPVGPKRRGVGIAAHDWVGGSGHPPGYAWVKLNCRRHRRCRHRERMISAPAPGRAWPRSRPRNLACRWTRSPCTSAIPPPGRTPRSAPAAPPRRRSARRSGPQPLP